MLLEVVMTISHQSAHNQTEKKYNIFQAKMANKITGLRLRRFKFRDAYFNELFVIF